jgi:hypothetical protein
MLRVQARCNWYLLPNNSYASLETYIHVTRAALTADMSVYQAEVAADEAAHSKRLLAELKAERAAKPMPASKHVHRALAIYQYIRAIYFVLGIQIF